MNDKNEILRYFPHQLYQILMNVFEQNHGIEEQLQEIRIRVNRPVLLKLRQADVLLEYNITQEEVLQILERLCENSIYAYKKQICEGFLTVKGGHRVGIVGSCVIENGEIMNIKYISSLNFRIARQVINCSNKVLREVIDPENNTIYNTVLMAPPGRGKTTMLRDIVRRISNGINELSFSGKTCGVVDERGEIAACFHGIPQNDIGIRTDVIENVSKEKGIRILIRSMAPEIIACDEIGSKEDVQAIKTAFLSGVKGIFTMHGNCLEDIKNNPEMNELLEKEMIQKVLFL